MKYILARTHHNKRAKRHILTRSDDLDYLITFVNFAPEDETEYDYEIYSGNWKLLYKRNNESRMHHIKDGE